MCACALELVHVFKSNNGPHLLVQEDKVSRRIKQRDLVIKIFYFLEQDSLLGFSFSLVQTNG